MGKGNVSEGKKHGENTTALLANGHRGFLDSNVLSVKKQIAKNRTYICVYNLYTY